MSQFFRKMPDEERQDKVCSDEKCGASLPLYRVSVWLPGGIGCWEEFMCEKCYKKWKGFQSHHRDSSPSDGFSRRFGYQGSGGLKGNGKGGASIRD